MTSLRKFSIVLLVVAALSGLMAAPAQAQLTLSCNDVPTSMTLGSNYNTGCIASGGAPPYTIVLASGALPTGMGSIASGSEFFIQGTPNVANTYSFTIKVTDQAGSSQSVPVTITVTNGTGGGGGGGSVTLSSVSPNILSAGVSQTLTLLGTGFSSSSIVYFNGTAIIPNYQNSSTFLTVTIPSYLVVTGSLPIYVYTSGASSAALSVTVSGSGGGGAVSLTQISPTTIPLNTSFTLSLYGSGFTQGMLISFGSYTLSSQFINSGNVQVTIPAQDVATAGTINVSVGGSSSLQFIIGSGGSTGSLNVSCSTTAGPGAVGQFYSQLCSVSGGSNVYTWSVTGLPAGVTYSPNGSSVSISGTPTTQQSYSYVIQANDNVGHVGSLTITGSTGGSGTTGYGITSLSPSSASVGSGQITMIVFGNGFTPSSQVYFNGIALSTQYVSANQLNAIVLPSSLTTAGTYNVFVSTPTSGTTNSQPFTVGSGSGSATSLTSLSPTSIPVGSVAFNLTITGSGFTPGQLVTFGAYTLSSTYLNSNQISVVIPSQYLTTSQTVNVLVGNSNSLQFVIGSGSTGTLSVSCSPTTGPSAINTYYTQTCSVAGGTSPYNWTVSGLPTGLSQSAYTGGASVTISGTPSVQTSYSYNVQVSDSAGHVGSLAITGSTSSSAYSLTSLSPSSVSVGSAGITLAVLGTGFTGSSIVYFNGGQLSTTYISPNQLNAVLPASYLTVAQTATVIVYTSSLPTNTLTFTVGTGTTSGTLSLSCIPGVGPSVVNTAYSTTCSASGGSGNYTWTVPSTLPGYLTYNTTTGSTISISGTPTAPAIYNYTVKVSDTSSPVQTGSLQFAGQTTNSTTNGVSIILSSITPSSVALNTTTPVNITLIGSNFSSNSQVIFDGFPITTTFQSGSQLTATIPPGQLTFARAAQVYVTTSGSGSSNSLTFIIGNGGTGSQISISCNPGVGPAAPNSYYTANCSANGGTGPYTWTIVSGSLPTGLTLNPNGVQSTITGYTTLNGPYSYTLQVTDSSSPAQTTTLAFAGETGAGSGGGTSSYSISSLSPTSAAVGSAATTLTVTGNGFTSASQVYFNGSPLATTFVNAGQLNATIPATSLTTAQSVAVTVITSGQSTNALTFSVGTVATTGITISCNPTTGPSTSGSTYSTTCTAAGGVGPYNWSGSGLPFGLNVTYSTSNSVQIVGTLYSGSYNYNLLVTDSTKPTALQASYPFIGSVSGGTATSAISSVSPISAPAGSSGVTLNISGYGFQAGITTVEFGTTALATTVNSSTSLTAFVPANLVTSPSNVMVTLFGTASNTVDFFITSSTVSGITPNMLSFTYGIGGTLPPAQTLSVSSINGATGFSVVPNGFANGINWLVVNQSSGTIPGSISVSVAPGALPLGTYSGTLTFTGFGVGTTLTVPVTLTVVGTPTLTPSISNLTLTGATGSSTSKTINVTSSDGFTVFPYTITSSTNNGGNWLSVTPTSGTTPGSFTVTANGNNLTPSTYSGTVTLTASGNPGSVLSIPVTFVVTSPSSITASPTSLSFTALTGQTPATQTITVSASGNAAVNYTAVASTNKGGGWISATPSGTTPGSIVVTVNATNLTADTYTGAVTITAPGTTNSPVVVPVTFVVTAAPALTTLPTSLTFSYSLGGTTPAAQSVSVYGPNSAGNYNYSVAATTASGGNWLSVSPTSGTTPSSISASVSPSGLAAGTYTGTLTISSSGVGAATIPVTLNVSATAPTLTVTPSSLTFSATAGSATLPSPQTLSVSTSNSVTANYTVAASSTGNWLTATTSGTTPGTVTVSVNPANLAIGQYTGTLTISSPGATNTPQTVQVTLNVTTPPAIFAAPASLSFLVPADGSTPAPQSVTVISTGANTAFTASAVSQGNWLTVTGGGTTPSSLMVTVNPAGLLAGQTYNGAISITAPSSTPSNIQVAVTLTVAAPAATPLQVAPQSVYLTYSQGAGADLQHVTIVDAGASAITFTATAQTQNPSCGGWLTVVTPSGSATPSAPGTLAFNVNPSGLTARTCRGSLTITDNNGNVTNVPVYMAVSGASQSILLSQTAMNFVAAANGSAPAPQSFQVLNPGSGSMSWSITTAVLSGGSWLSVAPNAGTSQSLAQAGSPINVSVNPQGLAAGTYFGSVLVTSSGAFNSPQSITVSLTVQPSGATSMEQITPNGVIITGTNGTSDTQMVNITNSGSASVTFASAVITDDGQNWLTVSPSSGTVAAGGTNALSLSSNLNGLSGGLRHGTLRVVFSDGGVQTVDVQLAVSGTTAGVTGVRSCTSSNLATEFLSPAQNFQVSARVAIPLQVLVKDCSGNLLTSSSAAVDVLAGTSDIRLNYIGNGIWSGTYTPGSAAPLINLTARAVAVSGGVTSTGTVTVTGVAGAALSGAPAYVSAVVNAGSYLLPGLVAPGTMVSIFGSGLADGQASVFSVPFPNTLQGAQILLRGLPLPLFYASDGQVNAVIPTGLNADERDQLVVIRDTTLSVPVDLLVADVDPGIFATNQAGTGQGAILVGGTAQLAAPVGSVPGAGPATAGQVVSIFMSGLGAVTNPPMDGSASTGTSLTTAQPTVTIGGQNAVVSYSGLAPGEVGLYQLNVTVPAGTPTGDAVPVVVSIGNGISNTVTMAIK